MTDFDPTESAVPWKVLSELGISPEKRRYKFVFATPGGKKGAKADHRMVTGDGLGLLKGSLMANKESLAAYEMMLRSEEYNNPISWESLADENGVTDKTKSFDALLLVGGHARPGMAIFLEDERLAKVTSYFFEANKPIAAICHGVLRAARAKDKTGKSVLYDRKLTALLKVMEMAGAASTPHLKGYYRTYDQYLQHEVEGVLKSKSQFIEKQGGGNVFIPPTTRDSEKDDSAGFALRDRNLVTARWPGDAFKFSNTFKALLDETFYKR